MLGDHVALVCLLLLVQGLQTGSVLRHRRLDDPESPGGCPARDLAPLQGAVVLLGGSRSS